MYVQLTNSQQTFWNITFFIFCNISLEYRFDIKGPKQRERVLMDLLRENMGRVFQAGPPFIPGKAAPTYKIHPT